MAASVPPRRVVVTGLGLLSSLGWGPEEHLAALREATSGVVEMEEWQELGLRTRFGAPIRQTSLDTARSGSEVSKRHLQTMGPLSAQAVLTAEDAVRDAGLRRRDLARQDTVCILGAGVGSMPAIWEGARLVYSGKARRVRPFSLLQSMSSSPTAHTTQALGIGGRSYTIASACASSAHAIGHSYELIRDGAAQRAITGGTEELNVIVAAAFEAMRGALSSEQDDASSACTPFDARRSGLVLGAAAGVLVLEERDAALERGADIWGEILGFGANSQDHDLVLPEPSGEAAAACMAQTLASAGVTPDQVLSINAHATGTPAGDRAEARAIDQLFADTRPWVASTKGLTGHTLGAAGGLEAGFCLLMLHERFVAGMGYQPKEEPELPRLRWVPARGVRLEEHAASTSRAHGSQVGTRARAPELHLSNSFGFGGTNASLLLAGSSSARDSR